MLSFGKMCDVVERERERVRKCGVVDEFFSDSRNKPISLLFFSLFVPFHTFPSGLCFFLLTLFSISGPGLIQSNGSTFGLLRLYQVLAS